MSVERLSTRDMVLHIFEDLSIGVRRRKPGPPERIKGMTVGVVQMTANEPSPHNGEMHPDGDEILIVTSGVIRIIHDSRSEPLDIGAGEACLVRKGEWHRIDCVEDAEIVHITPGPRGEARTS